jgi:hypothetical protein
VIEWRATALVLSFAAVLVGFLIWLGAPWWVAVPACIFGIAVNGIIATYFDDE